MNSWCESCARKNLCYVVDDRPKCFVPITNTASGTPESYLAKALRFSQDSHEIAKTENCSEKPNNCEWSVEYAKEMLNTMPCEECGHWEHGAGDHYYCALLEMRQECCFESKGESTLMFANIPQTERSE